MRKKINRKENMNMNGISKDIINIKVEQFKPSTDGFN
jgi:hypothetical protein